MAIGVVVLTKSPSNGTDAVLYNIVPSASAITYDVNTETSYPSFVTVKLKKTVGSVVTYPSVLPDGYKMWYKLDTDSGYGQVSNNGYVYQDGWGTGNQIDIYLTNDGTYPNANKTNVVDSVEIPFINNGESGWSVSLSPSNIAIGDKDDGTVELTNAKSTIIAAYGNNKATTIVNGDLTSVNCNAEILNNNIVHITRVYKEDITYTYDNAEYEGEAYYPNGYILIPVKATYNNSSIDIILRLDFTVSAYIGNKINDFKITKIITDNGTIKAQVTEISQKADSVAITASQNTQSINNEVSRAESAEASIKVTANKICLSVSDSSMTTQFNTDYNGINVTDVTGDSGYRYQNSIFVQDQGNPIDHIVVLGANVTGLTVGKKYKMHFLINYHSGDGPIYSFAGSSASGENVAIGGPTGADEIGSYNKVGDYYDIDCYFVANATSMICGFKIVLKDENVYLDLTIIGLTIGVDIDTKLLDTGIDIENKKIDVTADTFRIIDNSGNVNTVFKVVGGVPMLDANLIQADTITARRLKTKSTGANTEIVSDTMSQYNDNGELRTLVHGGTLGGANSVVDNLFNVPVGVLNRTIYATNGLQQVFDIKLSASSFQIISLANVIKLLDAYENNNVPITCNITCNNVSAIGTELYISGMPGQNCNDAFIWSENPTTGALNITEGMSGTVVLSSKVAQTGCDLYLRLKVVFTNSSGSLSINNTNLNSNGDADNLLAQVTYGGDRTEMAGDGFMSIFGNYGIKITSSGIQKTTDGGTTWASI